MCGIPLTLDRDRGRSPLDLCEVIGSQLDLGRPDVLLEPMRFIPALCYERSSLAKNNFF